MKLLLVCHDNIILWPIILTHSASGMDNVFYAFTFIIFVMYQRIGNERCTLKVKSNAVEQQLSDCSN